MASFHDGRVQLKQNLIFQLRAGLADSPFQYAVLYDYDNYAPFYYTVANPPNYVYSSFYNFLLADVANEPFYTEFDLLQPFEMNAFFRNFVLNFTDVDSSGGMDTGIEDWGWFGYYGGFRFSTAPAYQFQAPTTNWATVPALLATNETRWLCSLAVDASQFSYNNCSIGSEIGVTRFIDGNNVFYDMAGNTRNIFGLPFLSTRIVWGNTSDATYALAAGNQVENIDGYFYPETEQPHFQTVRYELYRYGADWLPGLWAFSPANDTPSLICMRGYNDYYATNDAPIVMASVGSTIDLACYAKLAIQNGYPGMYAYLGQYFDRACTVDADGIATTNPAGFITTPHNSFCPMVAGPAALITMPDPDTGERGTCMVYCASIQFDKNHDSTMDLNFGGEDTTSSSQPFVFWANDNYDRGHVVDGSDYEQDDLGPVDIAKLPADQRVPDCQYTTNSQPAIPCTRDLEDYARLWLPGMNTILKALPTNFTAQLTLIGGAQIRIFQAVEPDGGTNYLFDEATASNQVARSAALYVGLLSSNSPIDLTGRTNLGDHFIFCGVQVGDAQVDFVVTEPIPQTYGWVNTKAVDATAYLQIKDIKQMYERWTVGENPGVAPKSVADVAVNGVTNGFQYTPPTDTNTPYILFVHGWNMETWEKDRYAETAFKRLYWQGYQGRFGSFRWPTYAKWPSAFGEGGILNHYDKSEFNAWKSGAGLCNLLTQLNNEHPGQVYLTAHSMGNVVAGEALRLAETNQLVNTYVAMEAAVPAHAYDATMPTRNLGSADDGTPNRYAEYYTNGASPYFAASMGAANYVNFFNTNDYAFAPMAWPLDQNLKPAESLGYHFFPISGVFIHNSAPIDFPTNTYELFAFCIEGRCNPLGTQPDVGEVFSAARQVELNVEPFNFGREHKYHSGQFRSNNMGRAVFWNAVLTTMRLK